MAVVNPLTVCAIVDIMSAVRLTSSFFQSRLKSQLKMAINRLRLVQQKETAIAKQQRRAVSI